MTSRQLKDSKVWIYSQSLLRPRPADLGLVMCGDMRLCPAPALNNDHCYPHHPTLPPHISSSISITCKNQARKSIIFSVVLSPKEPVISTLTLNTEGWSDNYAGLSPRLLNRIWARKQLNSTLTCSQQRAEEVLADNYNRNPEPRSQGNQMSKYKVTPVK